MADEKKATLREGYRGGKDEFHKGYTGGGEEHGYTGGDATNFVPPQGGSALRPEPPTKPGGESGGSSSGEQSKD